VQAVSMMARAKAVLTTNLLFAIIPRRAASGQVFEAGTT
jgi:hypothetical protein